ncbi:MAG: DNA recombination/repair protein RecA, partial [Bacteroidales bacterium]|nr:DNA recombination/repair protein RecA [Bacteroidales bacterium]
MTTDKAKENADALKKQKLKALEATLGSIEKNFGKGTIMRMGDEAVVKVETIS